MNINDIPDSAFESATEADFFSPQQPVFDEPGQESAQAPQEPTQEQQGAFLGNFLTAELVIMVADSLVPQGAAFAFNKFGYSAAPQEFKLNDREKKTIEPVLQKCLDQAQVNISNPWTALAVVAGSIYLGKAVSVFAQGKQNGAAKQSKSSSSATMEAPFGYDSSGDPLAPYGYTADGRIKKTAGRPKK